MDEHTRDRVNVFKRIYAALESKQTSINIGPTINALLLDDLKRWFVVTTHSSKPGYVLHFKLTSKL
jgi:hypothetical protein